MILEVPCTHHTVVPPFPCYFFSGGESEGGPKTEGSEVGPSGVVVWEWEGDGGKWSAYSAEHCKLLSDGLSEGEGSVTLQVSATVKMRVRFDGMSQTNVSTGWQRNVRCIPTSSSDPPGAATVWEWLSEDGEWVIFSTANQRLLTACKLCSVESISIEMTPGNQNTIDLKAMKYEMGSGGKKLGVRCGPRAG